ncbi:MAG TPA: tellurium resistance protein TerC [Candidatus Hydrogenedentes bacterium]|jgi:predicted tellurium resistance membrane protein TerC|nr:tellurium resistance protein TerC [Candidatus Hydrogenedentota bacterium]
MTDAIITLGMLVLLQAVLGFDNLLYISLMSKRAPAEDQKRVRTLGIAIAVFLRIALLFILVKLIDYFQESWFAIDIEGVFVGHYNLHSLIVLLGGAFILYTSVKEIFHMMNLDEHEGEDRTAQSAGRVIFTIVIMNLVFSFDSILSAMALSDSVPIMATAIIIGGVLMIWLADHVSTFLQKNRLYEVLGLFILFVVGIMLLTEGGHLAHMEIAGQSITPMNKMTFYFVISVLVLCDVVQSRYQRKLMAQTDGAGN